jgi:hypothetical protein
LSSAPRFSAVFSRCNGITRSAIDRPKKRCVTGTGVVVANGMASNGVTQSLPSLRRISPCSPPVMT